MTAMESLQMELQRCRIRAMINPDDAEARDRIKNIEKVLQAMERSFSLGTRYKK